MRRYLISGTVLLAICTVIMPCECFALTLDDNGYAWNSATPEERMKVCKIIASRIGRSYEWWYINLYEFYNTNNINFLKWNIKDSAEFIGLAGTAMEMR